MASLTWGTWVEASSGSWWWTGKPDVPQSMGLQSWDTTEWRTELNINGWWCFTYARNKVTFKVDSWASLVLRQYRICLQRRRPGFNPWARKIQWRRAWQPTPVFLPGEFPWAEEPGQPQFMGSQRIRHDWVAKHSTLISYLGNLYYYSFLVSLTPSS